MYNDINVLEGFYDDVDDKELFKLPDSSRLPYHLMNSTSSDYKVLSHILMNVNKNNFNVRGDVVSEFFKPFENFFLKVCKKENINVNTIFRAAINLTYHYNDLCGEIHTDHSFDHKNFIFTFNSFGNGSTFLFDKNNKLTTEIKQFKNKYTFFPGTPHAQGFCLPGERRIILVITFN